MISVQLHGVTNYRVVHDDNQPNLVRIVVDTLQETHEFVLFQARKLPTKVEYEPTAA